ncbi:DUF4143 domain-containing protein [Mycoplasma putrefaciens]|uniref:DUF4143 domain-containing protein n=1 Tax=Mycoplasma putrefaciens TaxID=2123 RepID=UPI0003A3DB42|nr:DUF4143 domain-containing protein [Mycoplasma putrefaciens]
MALSIGSLTSPTKLAIRFESEAKIKTTHTTVKKYLDYFEESFVLSHVKRFDIKDRQYFKTLFKYYFTDLGLRNARLNFGQIEDNHIVENIIYNELIRPDYSVDIGMVEHNFKKDDTRVKKQLEIDFVINLSSQNTTFNMQII